VRLPVLCLLLLAFGVPSRAAAQAIVSDVRVQGNTVTPDEEVVRLSGVTIGMSVDSETADEAAGRLRATGRFERVDVLKRFRSIEDPNQIVIVILLDEGPVTVDGKGGVAPRVRKAGGLRLMFLPLLDVEDGYGLSYGVRVTAPNPAGANSRLSLPLTWGGEKRAALEFEKGFNRGPVSRVQAGGAISRRTNPFYNDDDDRDRVWVRAERDLGVVRVGALGSWERAVFAGDTDRFLDAGVDVTVDTRLDPLLARNAVYARAALDRLHFSGGESIDRTDLDARGYLGLIGQTVLVVRAQRQDADRPLPPYLQPMLGGIRNLRGFKAGSAVGDTLVAGSTELRVPLTSPLSIGRFGVSAFVDVGTVYPKGERLRDQMLDRGVGGGVWLSAAVFRLSLVVAHGIGGDTRVHVGTNVSF
jgi:outer membrane protein assembly factor BamA